MTIVWTAEAGGFHGRCVAEKGSIFDDRSKTLDKLTCHHCMDGGMGIVSGMPRVTPFHKLSDCTTLVGDISRTRLSDMTTEQ